MNQTGFDGQGDLRVGRPDHKDEKDQSRSDAAVSGNSALLRMFTWSSILSLALLYTLLWIRMIHSIEQRTGSDFIGIYTFGAIAHRQGFQQIYDFAAQEQAQEDMLGFQTKPAYYAHVPYIALPAYLLVDSDYTASLIRWSILLLALNVLNAHILSQTFVRPELFGAHRVVLFAGAFLFFPTFSGLMNGQDDALLLLGAALCLAGLRSGRDLEAGLGLSLTTIRPQIALFLAIPFLFRRQKVFLGFAAGAAALGLLSLALVGRDGLLDFAASLRALESTIWVEPHARDMPSISGMIRRGFDVIDADAVRALVWGLYAIGIGIFSATWRAGGEVTPSRFGSLALASLLFVPYSHYHDLTLLLVPVFCGMHVLAQHGRLPVDRVAALPLAASIILMAGFAGGGALKFPAVYVVTAASGFVLLAEARRKLSVKPGRSPQLTP